MKILGQAVNMSLMDISKIFSLLQPKEEDEHSEQCQALNNAVSTDDVILLCDLLSQESYRKSINARSGWGIPVTPLRTAAALGHLRCLEVLLEHGAEVRWGQTIMLRVEDVSQSGIRWQRTVVFESRSTAWMWRLRLRCSLPSVGNIWIVWSRCWRPGLIPTAASITTARQSWLLLGREMLMFSDSSWGSEQR